MAKTFNRLHIDVNKSINSIAVKPVQGDTLSRYLDVNLYDNGLPIDLTGEVVRINFKKEDGTTFFNQGEVTNAAEGRCQFALTNEVLSDAKVVKAQISVWSGEGEILSTQVFTIYVTESIRNDEEVESENEFGVLVVLFQEIQNALGLMKTIAENFGEPGEKAAEFEAETFWQMLEVLASRSDVQGALQSVVKAALNSTYQTEALVPLDKLIEIGNGKIDGLYGGVETFAEDGTFTVPENVTKIRVTACGGGGGGGYGAGGYGGGGGGGGACIVRQPFLVTQHQSISIIIGKGGAGQTSASATAGSDGEATIIGSLVTLPGGYGGGGSKLYGGDSPFGGGGGGAGISDTTSGRGGNGFMKGEGDKGETSSAGKRGGSSVYGAIGGDISGGTYSYAGGGGASIGNGADDDNDAGYGGGGCGGSRGEKAKKGGDGIVIIEW